MKCVVTGCAGFIGSHLTERLLKMGCDVTGIDCFRPYYPVSVKRNNISAALRSRRFRLVRADLTRTDLGRLLEGAVFVFHEAAQPGVLASWGDYFSTYLRDNIQATQRLLEAARSVRLRKFIYASSSSVYGHSPLPMKEGNPLRPYSPYGVTKLAGEHLASLYAKNFGLPVVSLRYFTVFGPRQRPDMGFYKFFQAIRRGKPVTVYGDGRQTRDVTYVSDAVDANILAMRSCFSGEVFNVGGGTRISVNGVIRIMEELTGRKAVVRRVPSQKGDVRDTWADTGKARKKLGFRPKTGVREGLERQYLSLKG
jgi:UDP-glucose 4-epimerase